ncbi:MAG TPA: alpha/beta fold hydrolase [Solirubrobacteraceae bacterium]|nr:alpha/beta fold hydrolase [Solirubrobacteraceae bacterium]
MVEFARHIPIPGAVEHAVFDPAPEPAPSPSRRWWGRHLQEFRWQAELGRLVVDPVFQGRGVRRGDGMPVVAIPGFLAGDASLAVMRGWLGRMGYEARPSAINCNVDCSDLAVDRLERRIERIHDLAGRRVALLGHSRGGHFAKALACRRPDLVCAMVSMGAGLDTPFDVSLPTKAAIAAVRATHVRYGDRVAHSGCFTETCSCRFVRDYSADFPADLPLTSIYTRGDGVVWWEACVVPYARNVEVQGSHIGLAFNRKAYRAIADALADACENEAKQRAAARRHAAAAAL